MEKEFLFLSIFLEILRKLFENSQKKEKEFFKKLIKINSSLFEMNYENLIDTIYKDNLNIKLEITDGFCEFVTKELNLKNLNIQNSSIKDKIGKKNKIFDNFFEKKKYFILKYVRENCMGCLSCKLTAKEFWRIGKDCKSELINYHFKIDKDFYKIITCDERDINKKVSENCPMKCIKIYEL